MTNSQRDKRRKQQVTDKRSKLAETESTANLEENQRPNPVDKKAAANSTKQTENSKLIKIQTRSSSNLPTSSLMTSVLSPTADSLPVSEGQNDDEETTKYATSEEDEKANASLELRLANNSEANKVIEDALKSQIDKLEELKTLDSILPEKSEETTASTRPELIENDSEMDTSTRDPGISRSMIDENSVQLERTAVESLSSLNVACSTSEQLSGGIAAITGSGDQGMVAAVDNDPQMQTFDLQKMILERDKLFNNLALVAKKLREFDDMKSANEKDFTDESEDELEEVDSDARDDLEKHDKMIREELLSTLEAFLTLGLKRKLCQSVMDIAAQRHQQNTPIAVLTVKEFSPVLWDYLKETLDTEEVSRFSPSSLSQVETDLGRGKAWVCDMLNKGKLWQKYSWAFQAKALLERYFEEFSCVRNTEPASTLMKDIGRKLSRVKFNFIVDSPNHDKPKNERVEEPEKVWHYEIHAPWPSDQQPSTSQATQPPIGAQFPHTALNDPNTNSTLQTTTQHITSTHAVAQIPFDELHNAGNNPQHVFHEHQPQENLTIEVQGHDPSVIQNQPQVIGHNQTFTELSNFDPNQLANVVPVSHGHEVHFYDGHNQNAVTSCHGAMSLVDEGHQILRSDASLNDLISTSPNKELLTSEVLHANASLAYQGQPISANHIAALQPTAIYGSHQTHYVPQYHSMQMQPPTQQFYEQMGVYQPKPQMLPKIEELMAPPTSRTSQQQDYTSTSPAQVMYSSAPPGNQEFYLGTVPHPHYEPISPAMGENMPMYNTPTPHPPHAQHHMTPTGHLTDSPGIASDSLDLDNLSDSPLPKKFCPPDPSQLKIMPNNRTGSDDVKLSRINVKRNPTGRGRGRPRQRPKIQGLPPPMDKEEAKEQTATFHRVYERVRRTEIKKGYDILENLIPFHLRSDILGKKKHFSTTDVLNCARDYIEELKSDEVQHQIIIQQMETERDVWKNRLRKLTLEAIKRNKVLLSNESLPEFETMDYKTSLSRFIPHVCLPNIGIQTGVYQEIPHDEVSTPPPEAEGDTEVGEEGDFEEPGELNPDEQVNPREELVHGVPQTLQGDAENGQLNGEIPDDAAVLVNNIKGEIQTTLVHNVYAGDELAECSETEAALNSSQDNIEADLLTSESTGVLSEQTVQQTSI
ncbi:uncharacterized protein LOC142337607 isoform X2 [Convolutriloba macropyga]|uniref:uncharacterized protein LOC142337607 isoform X2 n=1 Tax=Convolutriloba macropyga TaxID=536237 RepID=UPI003F51DCC3